MLEQDRPLSREERLMSRIADALEAIANAMTTDKGINVRVIIEK